ncbi:MAG: hypothetical protein NTZ78_13785 [Candidatus Aureabacteria bacterium]|nr:hypothetical protein [Candidatus Auribacterota bacterium]
MKKLITVALSLMFVVCLSYTVIAGSLDSPGAPSAGSGMYTLQNLYVYLTSGTALETKPSFQEPSAAPGSTMKSTKQIGDAIKALFDQSDVTADNVELGKRFFCTVSGSWGIQTGTLVTLPRPTATPTITPTRTPTITPTPTITSTPTPLWLGWCNTKGGHWGPDGLGGMGCWFETPTRPYSCTSKCSSLGGSCAQANWNDDSQCSICKAFHPTASCTQKDAEYAPGWGLNQNCGSCYYRVNANLSCDNINGESTCPPHTRFCMCAMP